jgi:hypothetical protein
VIVFVGTGRLVLVRADLGVPLETDADRQAGGGVREHISRKTQTGNQT